MTTILLTGATGFLGSHLLKCLLNKNFKIIILKRTFSNIYRIKQELLNKNVKYIDIDIDKNGIENAFINDSIDYIIHCATEYGRDENSCSKVLETNLMFPIKLLECAAKYKVSAFINTDSYFNKENMSYNYLLNYSLSKKSLSLWLKYFSNKIKVINMVLEHIYGENDNQNKFVEQMIQQVAINQVPSIDLTNGEQKRDFIFVTDVCNSYLAAIEFTENNNFRYRQFDVGTGKKTSIKDFVMAVKKISNSSTILNFGAIPYRDDEIMCSVADITELSSLLKVDDFKDIDYGIAKIIDFYNNRITSRSILCQ